MTVVDAEGMGWPRPATPAVRAWRRPLATFAVAAGAMSAVFAAVLAQMLTLTRGRFVYTLDDAYIHLSMAEQILRGGYGINPHEPASASSSLLFPYLDAAGLALGFGQFAPLAIGAVAMAASLALIQALARAGGLLREDDPPLAAGLLVAGLGLALNLIGLVTMGMEHGLQVALALAALLGVVRLAQGRPAGWLPAVLALAPLVRFEGLAILGAGTAALALAGRRRTAAVTLAAALVALAAFAWRLHALGLPWLPSSVLVKAADAGGAGPLKLLANLEEQAGALIAALALVPVMTELADGRRLSGDAPLSPGGRIALFSAPILLAQLALGPLGWLNRYEAYALALGAMTWVAVYGARLRAAIDARGPLFAAAAVGLAAMLAAPYVGDTVLAPLASRSIYLQQAQMRRLVMEHLHEPVGANDIGQLSWRNDDYVLDLWGLGSEAARRARTSSADPAWMDRLARSHGVRLAMIYDPWFPRTPGAWVKLGELRARVPLTVGPRVAFYAVDAADAARLRVVIADWARGLPPEAQFDAAPAPPLAGG